MIIIEIKSLLLLLTSRKVRTPSLLFIELLPVSSSFNVLTLILGLSGRRLVRTSTAVSRGLKRTNHPVTLKNF